MRNIILTTILIQLVGNLFSQTFTNYYTIDGLLSDNVNCVDTDANGTVWFGTQAGVSKFDGTNWSSYTVSNSPGLVDNNIQAIHCAANGDVWVGTDFGASVYSGSSWTAYTTANGLGNNQIKCIDQMDSGSLSVWFGTNSGASVFDGANWINLGSGQGLPFGGVTEIDFDLNGDVWLGTALGGIKLYNSVIFSSITDANGLLDNRIRAIQFDGQNKWIGTTDGITVLNSANNFIQNHTSFFTLPAPDTLNPIEDIEMDSQGTLWVGVFVDYLVTEGGVGAYNGNQWFQFDINDGLAGPVVRALAVNNNDDVWVATSSGVTKISNNTLGLNAKDDNAFFEIYPNPSNDEINIKITGFNTNLELILFDATMKKIDSDFITNDNHKMATNTLSSGIYFLSVNNHLKKLIVE